MPKKLTKKEKDLCVAALWGGGATNTVEVVKALTKFKEIFDAECAKRDLGEYMFDAREALREELLLEEDER